jgi:thiamine-phosphate pyrophosphorylase
MMMSLRLPSVYPILDSAAIAARGAACLEVAEALIQGGAGILQYRHKGFWSRAIFDEASAISQKCAAAGIAFIVNDRADYAAILRSGLHVGQDDLCPVDARRVIGPDSVLGFSTHNPSQLIDAQSEPIDYVAFGPVFGTATKENPDPTTGISGLLAVRALTNLPLVAIGGITLANAHECWDAGADSVAIISGLLPEPFSLAATTERMRAWRRLQTL